MMLRYSLGAKNEAKAIERAVSSVLDNGLRTGDIFTDGMKKVGTAEMGTAVVKALELSALQS
jgi:3-isopropylmalate dehydrogenase